MHSQLQHNSLCFLLLSMRMENVVRNIQACFQTPKHLGMRSSFFTALISARGGKLPACAHLSKGSAGPERVRDSGSEGKSASPCSHLGSKTQQLEPEQRQGTRGGCELRGSVDKPQQGHYSPSQDDG